MRLPRHRVLHVEQAVGVPSFRVILQYLTYHFSGACACPSFLTVWFLSLPASLGYGMSSLGVLVYMHSAYRIWRSNARGKVSTNFHFTYCQPLLMSIPKLCLSASELMGLGSW